MTGVCTTSNFLELVFKLENQFKVLLGTIPIYLEYGVATNGFTFQKIHSKKQRPSRKKILSDPSFLYL